MPEAQETRIDKWLWAVRAFKTRTAAAEACRAGHVKVGGANVKPSRSLHIDETVTVQAAGMTRTFRVTGLIDRRVGAQKAKDYAEDLTPPEEYHRRQRPEPAATFVWPKGTGRPTKKARRLWEKLRQGHEE